MARTPTITDEQILEAAREVFLEHGLKATTAEIARRAGVSEGSVFRRYPSKQELFLASMGLPEAEFFDQVLRDPGEGELEEKLVQIGDAMLEFLEKLVPQLMMVASSGMLPQIATDPTAVPPVRVIKHIASYFAAEMKLGRMKRRDPEIAARVWLGTLHHYAFAEFVGLNEFLPLPKEMFLRGVVAMFLEGAGTEEEENDA